VPGRWPCRELNHGSLAVQWDREMPDGRLQNSLKDKPLFMKTFSVSPSVRICRPINRCKHFTKREINDNNENNNYTDSP
jgi:hypothetical protein